MRITHYSFGRIIINGETFTSDVIIYPDRVYPSWWRREGHILQTFDLEAIVQASVPFLIVGTGFYGTMKVPAQTLDYLKSLGIETRTSVTQEAVDFYNRTCGKRPTVAALHLTC